MNKLPIRTIEKLLMYLCFLALALILGMFVLGLQVREDSLVFDSFDRLACLIVGGIIGATSFTNG